MKRCCKMNRDSGLRNIGLKRWKLPICSIKIPSTCWASFHKAMISLTFFSMDRLALEKGLWQKVFFRLYTSLTLCTRSRVSRKSTELTQVQALLAAVSSSRQCTIWRWHRVRLTTTTELLCKNWSRKLKEVSSLIKLSRKLSRLSSSMSLISRRTQLRLVCVAQWRLTCPRVESLPTVKAFPKSLCLWSRDACRSVCLHPKNKF